MAQSLGERRNGRKLRGPLVLGAGVIPSRFHQAPTKRRHRSTICAGVGWASIRALTGWGRRDLRGRVSFVPTVTSNRDDEQLSFGISLGLRARVAVFGRVFGIGMRRNRVPAEQVGDGCPNGLPLVLSASTERGTEMKKASIASLETVSIEEARAYMHESNGDELAAAYLLAQHRNALDGSTDAPDETEVHHALFLLRRAQGLKAPSFDSMRVLLRQRVAA